MVKNHDGIEHDGYDKLDGNTEHEGADNMENKKFKSLDLYMLKSKKSAIVSSQEALKDVNRIDWSQDVSTGKKKVLISCNK